MNQYSELDRLNAEIDRRTRELLEMQKQRLRITLQRRK